jgi:hypothetical protein
LYVLELFQAFLTGLLLEQRIESPLRENEQRTLYQTIIG